MTYYYIDYDERIADIAPPPSVNENHKKKSVSILSKLTSAAISISPLWNLMRAKDKPSLYRLEKIRKHNEIVWNNQTHQWHYKSNKMPVADGTYMYVATTINKSKWQFWIANDLTFHSQLIGINPNDTDKINTREVRAAGHVFFIDALMLFLTNGSGHYKPKIYQMFYLFLEIAKRQHQSNYPITFQACYKNNNGEVETQNVVLYDHFFLTENNKLNTPGGFTDKVLDSAKQRPSLDKENHLAGSGLRFSSEEIKKEGVDPINHSAFFPTNPLQPTNNINTANQSLLQMK